MEFEDLIYEIRNGVAWIVINRPEKMNAFRGKTRDELIKALYLGGYDGAIGAIVLANTCVPHDQLDAEVHKCGEELCERSPTAIAKRSFNMDTADQAGIATMGMYALKLYYSNDESCEGVKALQEKRKPDFRKFAKWQGGQHD